MMPVAAACGTISQNGAGMHFRVVGVGAGYAAPETISHFGRGSRLLLLHNQHIAAPVLRDFNLIQNSRLPEDGRRENAVGR